MSAITAPVLSTPAEHILEETEGVATPSSRTRLSDEELYIQYEIHRTVREIKAGSWRRIALQFPDEMLVDAPRVFEHLRNQLTYSAHKKQLTSEPPDPSRPIDVSDGPANVSHTARRSSESTTEDVRLCILADTSYGACCVDEVAAEHLDADVAVHYGRSCLSPTARLPVIYVFTAKSLDLDSVVESFKSTYHDRSEKVCLLADIPYAHHLPRLASLLRDQGFADIFETEIVRDPSSLLPNRTVPPEVKSNAEALKEYSVFHISSPPTSLLLILSSRIRNMYIFPTEHAPDGQNAAALQASTAQLLRRRYALITRLSTVSIFGILINTLSVSNYMAALEHCQELISQAGKKSYVFVVGKVNAAKVANFSEIGGWVVIGCWESSLIESKDFYRPIITPFELEVALTDDNSRVWGGDWIGDFSVLLKSSEPGRNASEHSGGYADQNAATRQDEPDDESSGDEPPEFDLRTGKYVSHSRPMGRRNRAKDSHAAASTNGAAATSSSALIKRVNGEVATIAGQFSPAAQYLRTQRTWQGLGSDHEIAYERDEHGNIRGAAMEEGRSGVAKGYAVGDSTRS